MWLCGLLLGAADGDEAAGGSGGVDLLTCGSCRLQFPLAQFLQFVWHKVLACPQPTPTPPPSHRHDDDVIADRQRDVMQPRPDDDDDVSNMTSQRTDDVVGKLS